MKLDRVEIKNYRSIQDALLRFQPNGLVLVGMNESGKSNVLKALSLLGEDFRPSRRDDVREALPQEPAITDSFVKFIFKFENQEWSELFNKVWNHVLCGDKNAPLVALDGHPESLRDFCVYQKCGAYVVNIMEEKKLFSHWTLNGDYKMVRGWKKPSSVCPSNFEAVVNGEMVDLTRYALIRQDDLVGSSIPDGYVEDATFTDLQKLVGVVISGMTKEYLPDVIFWKYDEKFLMPAAVWIEEFLGNPDICIPLKNMFTLSGILDIKGSLEQARHGSANQFQNYLDRVALRTTEHFQAVWKEYHDIEFSLKLNGDKIITGIKEKNTHDFSRRSDGFKRFVTFLLLVSVKMKIDDLKNTLLLMDEPDTGLHPSGARYLRDELIRISKKNYVVYSTHSVFMIDPGVIQRHYLVKKVDEITQMKSAGMTNISEDEVLYNALGNPMVAVIRQIWTKKQ